MALRELLFYDRGLVAARFALAQALRRAGDQDGAKRELRNTQDQLRACQRDEILALTEGVRAGRLAVATAAELALLERTAWDA